MARLALGWCGPVSTDVLGRGTQGPAVSPEFPQPQGPVTALVADSTGYCGDTKSDPSGCRSPTALRWPSRPRLRCLSRGDAGWQLPGRQGFTLLGIGFR